MSPQLTVYYNTKCPVCNAGIDWQRSRLVQAARAGIIEFRDINLEPDALSRFGAGSKTCAAACMRSTLMASLRRRRLRHRRLAAHAGRRLARPARRSAARPANRTLRL